MSGADDFISRWSRRKLEAKRPDPADVAQPEPEPDTAAIPAVAVPGPELPRETEPPPTLPDPDELTPDADLSAFLRDGVPKRLRNAALRRMWSLDPNIRDFVGDARDYAYDWNSPGGVPGFGPILPGDDVAAMVAGIFGSRQPENPQPAVAPETPDAAARQMASSVPQATSNEGDGPQTSPEPAAPPDVDTAGADEDSPFVASAVPAATGGGAHEAVSTPPEPSVRRHGGAKPV